MTNFNTDVAAYLNQAPVEQQHLLQELHLLVHKAVPGTSEAVKWGFPVFSLNGNYAYLRSSKTHITLGFYYADDMKDPQQLLEGEGKAMRHVKIRSKADIDARQFTEWLKVCAKK